MLEITIQARTLDRYDNNGDDDNDDIDTDDEQFRNNRRPAV